MFVIANETNEYLIDAFRASYPDITFICKYRNFEDILESGLTITKSSITFSKKNGVNITRRTKIIVILCNENNINSKRINEIRELYGNIFHIYTENANEIIKYFDENKIDTFEFRNYLDSIFKQYKNADYLMLDIK